MAQKTAQLVSARTALPVSSRLRLSNTRISRFSCAKAFTTRMPDKVSLTRAINSDQLLDHLPKNLRICLQQTTAPITTSGTGMSTYSVNLQFINSNATTMPRSIRLLMTRYGNPSTRKSCRRPLSRVTRDMSAPTWRLS